MPKPRTQPALRLMIYDATEKRWGRFVNLSLIWRIGGWLYRLLGRLDACHGATSWADALSWLGQVEPARPIAEIQYWGHGRWGRALILDEVLDIRCLEPSHPLFPHLDKLRTRLVGNVPGERDLLVRESLLAPDAVGIPSHDLSNGETQHTGKDSPEGGCEKGFTHQRDPLCGSPIPKSAIQLPKSHVPLWWFRTCETLGGQSGQAFAAAWSRFFNCRVAGHTHVIGFYQSGLHSLRPGETPTWSASEGIIEGDARNPQRASKSSRGKPNTITCFGGRIPDGW